MKFLFYLLILTVTSCNSDAGNQSLILEQHSKFNLEAVNFSEDVTKLFSKHITIDADGYFEYDSLVNGTFTQEKLLYPTPKTISKPRRFGYVYRSPLLNSVARYNDLFFEHIAILTDSNKKPVAYYAEAKTDSIDAQKNLLHIFNKKYGKPKYAFNISRDFNICSYEWDLKDKTIQLETGFGLTSDTSNKDGIYFNTRILIIDNQKKDAVYKAHFFEYSDKVEYQGKLYSPEELGLARKQIEKDIFLLNSTNEEYIKDPFHSIKFRSDDPKIN